MAEIQQMQRPLTAGTCVEGSTRAEDAAGISMQIL